MRGDGTAATPGLSEPIRLATRLVEDEHLLAVRARELELRRDTVSASVRVDVPQREPTTIDTGRVDGRAFTVDDRNRRIDVRFEASPTAQDVEGVDEVDLSATPDASDFIQLTYPERALRKHESFPLRYEKVVHRDGKVPTQLAVDVRFTVREVTADHVELGCEGTRVESARRGQESAIARFELSCRGRIDRRDGRTARWWIDTRGIMVLPNADAPVRVEGHFDITIGQTADTAEVCARAAEPDGGLRD